MRKVAYWECIGGIAGDMALGSLLDAGLPLENLRDELARLPLTGYRLWAEPVTRAGVRATKVHIEVAGPEAPRTLEEVLQIIRSSSLPDSDKSQVSKVFHLLAQGEARAHGQAQEGLHLHETGAIDALIDVVGTIAGLRLLGVEKVHCSPLPIPTMGGHMAIAPATAEIIAIAGAPLSLLANSLQHESVTPTGAAIVCALASFTTPPMTVEKVGYGAGSLEIREVPNVVRLWLGHLGQISSLVLLETNIDDMTPEGLAYVHQRLLEAGAKDAWMSPIYMKKGRPGVVLSVLCSLEMEEKMTRLLLQETTTLGVRRRAVERWEAPREEVKFQSSLGLVAVKVRRYPWGPPLVSPEFEECQRLARALGLPIWEVYHQVVEEAKRHLGLGGEGQG